MASHAAFPFPVTEVRSSTSLLLCEIVDHKASAISRRRLARLPSMFMTSWHVFSIYSDEFVQALHLLPYYPGQSARAPDDIDCS